MAQRNFLLMKSNSNTIRRFLSSAFLASTSDIYITSNVKLRKQAGIKPLNGIKVALLNRSSIGGFSANVLEDYGASVQHFCEPLTTDEHEDSNGRLIDLSRIEDVNLIKSVSQKVDILVDYLHERRMESVGLVPEEMLKINSRLILARVSGFGSVSGQFGGDSTFAAMSGAMSDGLGIENLETVLKEAHALTLSGRSHIITGLIMALYEREHNEKGQLINFNVTESITYIKQVADRSKLKIPDEFHRFYRTSDHHLIAVAVINPVHQKKMLDELQIKSPSEIHEAIGKRSQKDLLFKLKDINTISPIVHSKMESQ